jgi:hypothetical protein
VLETNQHFNCKDFVLYHDNMELTLGSVTQILANKNKKNIKIQINKWSTPTPAFPVDYYFNSSPTEEKLYLSLSQIKRKVEEIDKKTFDFQIDC